MDGADNVGTHRQALSPFRGEGLGERLNLYICSDRTQNTDYNMTI